MIKAVVFDIDGVLIDSLQANCKFFQDLMIRIGHRPPTSEEYRTMFHLPATDVIKKLVSGVSDEEVNHILELYQKNEVKYAEHMVKLMDGVFTQIKTLSKKYQLGLVTSRIKIGVYKLPALSKIVPFFQEIISYEDTKNHKPDPEPLFVILDRLKVTPNQAVYIGDAETDMLAANAAGMKFIAFNNPFLTKVDGRISKFSQLSQLIASL